MSTDKNNLPVLYIMAKTYGAAKEFVDKNDIESKVKWMYRDIKHLHDENQLRGMSQLDVYIVEIPRAAENERYKEIKKMAEIRKIVRVSASAFLYSLGSSG